MRQIKFAFIVFLLAAASFTVSCSDTSAPPTAPDPVPDSFQLPERLPTADNFDPGDPFGTEWDCQRTFECDFLVIGPTLDGDLQSTGKITIADADCSEDESDVQAMFWIEDFLYIAALVPGTKSSGALGDNYTGTQEITFDNFLFSLTDERKFWVYAHPEWQNFDWDTVVCNGFYNRVVTFKLKYGNMQKIKLPWLCTFSGIEVE